MIIGEKAVTDALKEVSDIDLRRGVARGIMMVQEAAKEGCRSQTGELRESIYTSMEGEGEIVRGVCYTNKSYAPYVEFGTGPAGQAHHEGISPEVAVAYTQSPWWIHEGSGPNEIDRETAEFYHFFHIDTPQGRFYQCTGQPARPFLYPALKNNEERIMQIIKEEARPKR